MEPKEAGVPQRAGLYLARTDNYKWWNMVVAVVGKAPFLKCWAYDRAHDTLTLLDTHSVTAWSERLIDSEE